MPSSSLIDAGEEHAAAFRKGRGAIRANSGSVVAAHDHWGGV